MPYGNHVSGAHEVNLGGMGRWQKALGLGNVGEMNCRGRGLELDREEWKVSPSYLGQAVEGGERANLGKGKVEGRLPRIF